MAIFKRLTKAQIEQEFTHKGLYAGMIPIYIDMRNSEAPGVAVRNWYPDCLIDVAEVLLYPIEMIWQILDPEHQPMFALVLTGLIKKGSE
jgi:hypothetical protein